MQRQLEIVQKIFDISEKVIQEWIAGFVGKPVAEVFQPPVQYQERIEMVKAADPNGCYYISIVRREDRKENEDDIVVLKSQPDAFLHVIGALNQSVQVVTAATLKSGIQTITPEQQAQLQTIKWEYQPALFCWRSNLGGDLLCIALEKMSQADIDRIIGVAAIDAPSFEAAP